MKMWVILVNYKANFVDKSAIGLFLFVGSFRLGLVIKTVIPNINDNFQNIDTFFFLPIH